MALTVLFLREGASFVFTSCAEDEDDDAARGTKPAEPKYSSLTDPAAAWTNKRQNALFAYGTNYLIDTKEAIIVDVEATPAGWSAEFG